MAESGWEGLTAEGRVILWAEATLEEFWQDARPLAWRDGVAVPFRILQPRKIVYWSREFMV